jgi:DNA primase
MIQYYFQYINSIYVELITRKYQRVLFGDLDKFKQLPSGQYKACCPFHENNSPAFSIASDKPVWYCFKCKTGGNWIQYLQKKEGLAYNQALGKLVEVAASYNMSQIHNNNRSCNAIT